MLKFLLGLAIVAFTSFCGRFLAKKYRQRRDFFKQWREFNERFLSEISYYRRPIKEFIAAFSYEGDFRALLNDYCLWVASSLPPQSIFKEEEYLFLKAEEKQIVIDYFSMLGKGDSTSQKGYFSSVKDTLLGYQKRTEDEAKRYGDLYVKIGFLCGLLLLILIV